MFNIFKKNTKNNTTTTYIIYRVCETNSAYGDVGIDVYRTTDKQTAEIELNRFNKNNIHKDFIYYVLVTR